MLDTRAGTAGACLTDAWGPATPRHNQLQTRDMYNARQLAYAPTPYIPRSALSATINVDEVRHDATQLVPGRTR